MTENCYYSKKTCYDCEHNKECEMRKEYHRQWKEYMSALPSWE